MEEQKTKKIKKFSMALVLVICILIVSCIFGERIGLAIKLATTIEMDSIEEISIAIEENTLTKTSASITITDTTGKSNRYGGACQYRIEKKVDNEWDKVKKIKEMPSTLQVYFVGENNKLEQTINWSETYGELEKGIYRLVKSTEIEKKDYDFSVEFEIL